ncbi:MAG TPA: hypothetical protein VF526_15390 [Solirubrobacteraceae bacterium]
MAQLQAMHEMVAAVHALAARQGPAAAKLGGWGGSFGEREKDNGRWNVVGNSVAGAGATANAGLSGLQKAADETGSAMLMMAGGPVLGAFSELGGKMTQFVGALNPAAVQVFDVAMKDLSAVVGTALMPVFSVLTGAVKQASNLLLPVAQELAPVFAQIAEAGMQVFQPMMQLFANVVRYAMTPLQVLADILTGIAPLYQAYYTIAATLVGTLAELLGSLMGGGYKDAMKQTQTAFQKLANYAVIAAGALAKMAASVGFGAGNTFLKNLIEAAKGGKQGAAEGLGAATQGRVTDIRSFEKEQMAAAFTATQGMGDAAKTQEAYLAEAVKTLEGIQGGALDAKEVLRKIGNDIVKAVTDGIDAVLVKMGFDPAFGNK